MKYLKGQASNPAHLQDYTESFFHGLEEGSRRSAEVVVPMALQLVHPTSVIDVGCGTGVWLSVFKQHGVKEILGVDGSWVNKQALKINEDCFLERDLTRPLEMHRKFDLVVSLEVAEHLSEAYAQIFIDSLVRLGPVILFSAAVPFQGGTHHVNEQWPEYWVRHFQERDYVAIDCFRRKIWQDDTVDWWYAQNMLLFVARDYLERFPLLKNEFESTSVSQLSLVHPKRYTELATAARMHSQKNPDYYWKLGWELFDHSEVKAARRLFWQGFVSQLYWKNFVYFVASFIPKRGLMALRQVRAWLRHSQELNGSRP